MADTTTPHTADPDNGTYWHGTLDQAEIVRLDAMHNGIKNYFDGKIFLAPLADPRAILDIGTGSGIWAIECAQNFPDAKVTAVDINPMLPRPVPSNFQFQQLDILADSLPWEAGSFDVVHVRFLLVHLPEPQRVLERIAKLVKPGGWLLIEEVSLAKETKGDAPTVRTGFELVYKFWESNGQVPAVGSKLESWLRQTGTFSEVNVHEAIATFGSQVSSGGLSLTLKNSWRRSLTGKTHPGLLALGYTPEFKERLSEEYDASEWQHDCPVFCVWAQRSV
ncbi:S-adenosyl-L-methionine-dependent methyltransferase [Lactarius tabidus]